MLALTRRIKKDSKDMSDRRIMIGGNIVITLCEVSNNHVVIGIESPRGIEIMREELLTEEQVLAIERAAGCMPRNPKFTPPTSS